MFGLKTARRNWVTMLCIVIATPYATSCSDTGQADAPNIAVDSLLGNGAMFNSKKLVVDGCLDPNEHGLVLSTCQPGLQVIPLLYDDRLASSQLSYLYKQALRSRIETRQPLAISLCGTYHQTAGGKDRWLEVTAFSLGHKSGGAREECQN